MGRARLGNLDWSSADLRHRRQHYVPRMFDIIAPRYDIFTRAFSYGMDARWKSDLLRVASGFRVGTAVDLACGTGDFLDRFARDPTIQRAIGIDLSMEMAVAAISRTEDFGGRALLGDLAQLPLASGVADLVTVGYGYRNAPRFEQAIAETYRILRPGGLLLVLDFYRPASRIWRTLFRAYLSAMGSLFGLMLHGEAAVYRYIAPSMDHYMTIADFEQALQRAGFSDVRRRPHILGGIALHRANKP